MKRIVAVLLTAILLISCLPLTGMAAKTDTALTAAGVEAKFRLLLEDLELKWYHDPDDYFYHELAQYPAKNPEWILLRAGLFQTDLPDEGFDYNYAVFGNKLIRANTHSAPFRLGYGVYDVKSGAFYDLIDAWDMNLNNLRDVWDGLAITDPYSRDDNGYETNMYVIGDADADGEVTILDATRIQRCIAELDENPWEDFAAIGHDFIRGADIAGITDFDRDGDTTVMDATRIQRTIAELPSVLTYQVKWSERSTTPDNFKYREKYLVTDRSQLHKDYPDEKRMLDDFDDSFFEDHMLVGANLVGHMEKYITTLSGVSLDTTGTLNIDFRCKPASTVPSVDMHYSVCLELSKAFLDDIKDIKVNIEYVKPTEPDQPSVCADIPQWNQIDEIPDDPAAEGYLTVAATEITPSAPSWMDLGWGGELPNPDSKGTQGYVLLIRSKADIKKYLPDFDKEGKYDGAFFKNYAIICTLVQGNKYYSKAYLTDIAVKGNTLYVSAGESIDHNYVGEGEPVSLPVAPIVHTFRQVKQSDVASVDAIRCWTAPYPSIGENLSHGVIEDYRCSYGDFSNEQDEAYLLTKPADVAPALDKLFVSDLGDPVDHSDHTFKVENDIEYDFVIRHVIAMRVFQGSSDSTVTVKNVRRSSRTELTVDVTRSVPANPTPDMNWRFIFVEIFNYGKDFTVKVNTLSEEQKIYNSFVYTVNKIDNQGNKAVTIDGYIGSKADLTIPDTIEGYPVTEINTYAFKDNKIITSVSVPDSVIDLNYGAFSGCENLVSIKLPKKGLAIRERVFSGCKKLASVTLPEDLTEIWPDVFSGCASLTEIDLPDTVQSVDDGAFCECTSLKSVRMSAALQYIGPNAFKNCSSLSALELPDGVQRFGNYAFYGCTSLKTLNLPGSVTLLGNYVFKDCTALTSVSVPGSVTKCEWSVFEGCTALTSVTLSEGLTLIGTYMFKGCTSLSHINIPGSVDTINGGAFEGCTSLKTLSIPRGVKTVGKKVAKDCTALERVTFAGEVYPTYVGVEIPPVLNESIGESAFEGCTALTSVTMPDEIKTIGKRAFYGCTKLDYINLPASLTAINEYTFANCESLWTLNHYGDHTVSLKAIGDYAFLNCESLEYVKFDNTLTSIGDAAFRGCTSLGEVMLKENLKTIGADAFLKCIALKKLTVPKSVKTIGKNALGYTVDEETNFYVKRDDFTIRGYIGSAAQTYANNKDIPFEAIDADDQLFTADITDDKKVSEGAYGTALAYEELSTDCRVFNWDYQTYGDGSEFLSQPYRFAIIRTMDQYNAYFSNERFENIDAYEAEKPIYQVIDGKNIAIDESFFEENALIVGVGYLHTGDEYLYFDEIQQSADGKSLWFRFNRYTYGDINPYLPYAANILGYCFAAAKVPKAQVKDVENVYMLPQIKRLPTVTTPLSYGSADPVIPENALDEGYTFIPQNEISVTAPYDVGRYGLGYFALDDEWEMGHILLIRSMAEFKKHFPGFEISDDYFDDNALVAMVNQFGAICSEYTCSLSCIAVKDDVTLYVNPQISTATNFVLSNGIFDPMMVSDRETCYWTFRRVSQQDVAKVGEIKTWRVSGQQALGTASNVRKDVEGYKLVGGLGDENMAIRVTSPEELETALDRVFTDKNGHKVDRSGFSYADKLKSADYYKTNGLVVMRVHRGAHNNCFDVLPIHEQFDAGGKLTGLSVDIMRYIPQQSAAGDEYDILLLRITNVPFTGDLTVNTYDQSTPQPVDINWAFYAGV